jgi:ATP-dependent Clp protease ATP-binding subunit ClpC
MKQRGFNFTETVRRALAEARVEAPRLRHEYVGTEHVLLGLIAAGPNVATRVVEACGVRPDTLRDRIDGIVTKGHGSPTYDAGLPYTSRAKKVLELAMSEASDLDHDYVGTQHALLGLLREEKGIGAQVLIDSGITLDAARERVRRLHAASIPDGEVIRSPHDARPPAPQSQMAGMNPGALLRLLVSVPQVAAVFAEHRIDVERLLDDLDRLA